MAICLTRSLHTLGLYSPSLDPGQDRSPISLTLLARLVGIPCCLCRVGLLGRLRGRLGWEPVSHGPAQLHYTALGTVVKLDFR